MNQTFLTFFFVCLLAVGVQAQTTTPPPPASTAGNVWRVTYFDVKPGKTTDYLNFLRSHSRPILDEQKKQGLILDYKFFSQPTLDSPEHRVHHMSSAMGPRIPIVIPIC